MRIEITSTCLHGRDRFAAGDTRVVDDGLGGYLVAHGWAVDLDGAVESGTAGDGPVEVDIDSVTIGVTTGG